MQQRAPVVVVELHRASAACAAVIVALDGVEFHVQQTRGVVGTLERGTQTQEMVRVVLQHGALRDAAREMGAVLDPLEEPRRVALEGAAIDLLAQFQPGLVVRFPDFGGQRAAHRARVLSRRTQAGNNRGAVFRVADHEVQHFVAREFVVGFLVGRHQLTDREHALPGFLRLARRLRQHRGVIGHVQQPRGVRGTLDVAGHPVQMVGGTAQHAALPSARSVCSSSSTQVSLVPPPCDELTTSEPSFKATRVSPPATIFTVLPLSTNGRRSIWRGAMPLST
ncbi:hypothetical protein D3C86_1410320 [compost metagenome]